MTRRSRVVFHGASIPDLELVSTGTQGQLDEIRAHAKRYLRVPTLADTAAGIAPDGTGSVVLPDTTVEFTIFVGELS